MVEGETSVLGVVSMVKTEFSSSNCFITPDELFFSSLS